MVTINIDGKIIEVPEGTTVLRAAQSAGIDIPTLCDHPHLTPYGGCRLCLVEVEGARTLQPSCTLPASNNMVIKTNTKKVLDARKFVLTLIFSERNHFCPYCQVSGGDCELQNAAYHEGMTHWPLQPNWQPYLVDASHPYIILENNRCILCRRCVRACGELIGNFTLGFEERGAKSILVADTGVPLGESTCISCGACVEVCPTGALIDRWSAYLGHEVHLDSTKTVCVGCSLGCGINVLTRDNNLVRIEGDWDSTFNEGILCEIGKFQPMLDKCDRIHTPMIRKNGSLKAVTWDEAISEIANTLKPLAGKTDGGIAGVISTRQPIETLHSFKSLLNKLGASVVTSTEEGFSTSAAASLAEKIGKPYEEDLGKISDADCVIVVGTDLTKDHQVASFFIKRNLPKGTALVVIDKDQNGLDQTANKILKPAKGKLDLTLKGILAASDKLGIAKKKSPVKAKELDDLAKNSGISSDDLLDVAFIIAGAQHAVIVFEESSFPTELLNFADLMNASIICIKGDANSLAASQYCLDSAFKSTNNKAVFVALGDDELSQKTIKEIESIPFKVIQASFTSSVTAIADVVLPAATWLEQGGHFISSDGRIQEAVASLVPSDEIYSINETLNHLAKEMNISIEGDWLKALYERVSSVALSR